ncbi:bis(5'-nucleosyl)-tetraphosphatase (symmetrical) YqeK [Ruminococcaceae bacterium OttesenSCG-928-A11]|nr:bis(5'-nucleosyl)-tetraphosphatase (symmetrical) YqeK [Ruminococcaceae bacterium OttesenSCG-928-A11]
MTIEQAKHLAKKTLTPRRYRHTKNVAAAARALAQRWGVNPAKAELAGWLHDIVKEYTRGELLQLLGQDGIMAGLTAQRPAPIWHGPCGAIYARYTLGVEDADILDAIACHTTGRRGMTTMDKVLFLADATSAERSFDGVEDIRTLSQTDLDAAVLAAMENNVAYLEAKGKKLDTETLDAIAALKEAVRA